MVEKASSGFEVDEEVDVTSRDGLTPGDRGASRRDGDSLDPHEVQFGRRDAPNLEAELDRLANASRELVVRTSLGMAARKRWHPRDEGAVAVLLDDDVELARGLGFHGTILGRKASWGQSCLGEEFDRPPARPPRRKPQASKRTLGSPD